MKYSACAIVIFFALSGLSKAEQPYIVKNEDLECFNGLKETIFRCELKLVGRKRQINGTITFRDDMASDHYGFQLQIFYAPLGDDQFRQLPMGVPRMGICEGFKEYYAQVLQPSFIQGENTNLPFMPVEGLCPFPKGEYFSKNLEFDTDYWPNQIPRGVLKAVVTFFKDEVNVGGGAIYLRIEDRV